MFGGWKANRKRSPEGTRFSGGPPSLAAEPQVGRKLFGNPTLLAPGSKYFLLMLTLLFLLKTHIKAQ